MINKHSHYSLSIFINLKNVLFCVVLIFILYATFGCSAMKSSQKAPEFDITLYQTEDYSEGDLYRFTREKSLPIVLNFWFPSCPPCVAEMPEINNLYKEHKNDVEVVGIQLVGLDSVDDGKNFVKDTSISTQLVQILTVLYLWLMEYRVSLPPFSLIQKVMFSKLGREL